MLGVGIYGNQSKMFNTSIQNKSWWTQLGTPVIYNQYPTNDSLIRAGLNVVEFEYGQDNVIVIDIGKEEVEEVEEVYDEIYQRRNRREDSVYGRREEPLYERRHRRGSWKKQLGCKTCR